MSYRESAAELTLTLRHLSSKPTLTDGSLATALASLASTKAQNWGQTLAVEQTYALAARLCAQVEEGLQRKEGLKEKAEREREVKRAREGVQRTEAVGMQRWCASSRGGRHFQLRRRGRASACILGVAAAPMRVELRRHSWTRRRRPPPRSPLASQLTAKLGLTVKIPPAPDIDLHVTEPLSHLVAGLCARPRIQTHRCINPARHCPEAHR
ncbi:hypothetical protein K438DRAFT_1871125 [Mycena galopus ATCC 62051]|nr:hypothetical protein K438DRAFT_1871125 [Mycena galopus ATCC 62051]